MRATPSRRGRAHTASLGRPPCIDAGVLPDLRSIRHSQTLVNYWRIASLSVLGKGLTPPVFTSTDVNCASIPRKQECPVRRVALDAGASANVYCRRVPALRPRSLGGRRCPLTALAGK